MSDIDDVIERLVTEPGFRTQLAADPASALTGYALEDDDLEVLAATLDDGGVSEHGVEQRTSKSALFGVLLGLSGGGGGSSPTADSELGPEEPKGIAAPREPDEAEDQVKRYKFERAWPKAASAEEGVESGPLEIGSLKAGSTEVSGGDDGVGEPVILQNEGADLEPSNDPTSDTARRPPFDASEVVPHTITYTDVTKGTDTVGDIGHSVEGTAPLPQDVEPEPARTHPSLIGEITQKTLTEEPDAPAPDGASDVLAAAEDTEPALNAYYKMGWNGSALDGDYAVGDPDGSAHSSYQERIANEAFLAQPDDGAAPMATDDPEVKYVPVRRTDQPESDELGAPDESTSAGRNDVAIEEVVISNEGVDPEPEGRVGDGTNTSGANRDLTVKGSKVKEN